jgi:uncharacterized protein (UPF0333 family)
MHIKKKRGQSTVEYVLLVTAVVTVVIALVTGHNSGTLQNRLNETLGTAAQGMADMQGNLSASHGLSNASIGPPLAPYSVVVGNSST